MLEVSIFIIAVAFAALVLYLIFLIKEAATVLRQTASTLNAVRQKLEEVSFETKQLLANINKKSENLDPFFDALNVLGDISLEKVKGFQMRDSEECFREFYEDDEPEPEGTTLSDWISWITSGVGLWQRNKH